jgi:DNA-binding GntR family transcriptional regulator
MTSPTPSGTPAFHRGTLATSIALQLKHAILAGELLPGDRLSEQSIAERFGVSPTPVREAVRLLTADGLVEYLDRKGVRVISLTEAEIVQAFAVRGALEREALREAVPVMTDAQRERLFDLARRTDEARGQLPAILFEIDRDFHAYFVECAGNPWLSEFSSRMGNVLTVARLHLFAAPDIDSVLAEHVAIAQGVLKRDAVAAVTALDRHVQRVCANAVRAHKRGQLATVAAGEGEA